ncbi:AAA family ATPase [Clostridium sp. MSJ-4]|uniref:nitrogenase n=1 Tax=Clostridium simiarum TaxID=2841506 RepID=A0ABS6EZE6_9CLOT|nr:nitrogenase iron protein NifH [Clostridium simiarum]MBU5591600.1 AAA family ATPase [Clostridium simiarum]
MLNKKVLKIALYGKGGIGKSTIATNLSAAFSKIGLKVLHIGCDPKGDSTRNLVGHKIPTVMEVIRKKGTNIEEKDILHYGFNEIACIEAGGPKAGMGCAGMGITMMTEELQTLGVFNKPWDIVIYDVLGDVVCGGFAVPMREKYVDKVYIVSSSEFMSIYAANNILKSVSTFSDKEKNIFGGLIHNRRTDNSKDEIIKSFAKNTNINVLKDIPFTNEIGISELMGKTVFEALPDSQLCETFISLAYLIKSSNETNVPSPLEDFELEAFRKEALQMEMKK